MAITRCLEADDTVTSMTDVVAMISCVAMTVNLETQLVDAARRRDAEVAAINGTVPTQFVSQNYSRVRASVRGNHAASLYFLDNRLADATIAASHKSNAIETFFTNGNDEIEVVVKNVALEDLCKPPFKVAVDFEKICVSGQSRGAEARAVHRALRVRREGPRTQRVHSHQPPGPHDYLLR
jgi:hypothetical protein